LALCAGRLAQPRPDQRPMADGQAAVALPSHRLARRIVGLRSCSSFQTVLMNNNKNLLLAIALAAAVLFLWQFFVANPAMKVEQARQAALSHQEKGKPAPQGASGAASGAAPAIPGIAAPAPHMSRDAALKAGGQRVAIDTPMVDGSILLKGARI